MNNEQLQNKIAALLNVADDKRQYVFSIFKKMLSDYLTIGEALTIDNLGTFQLKEQLSHSSETKLLDPSEKALTLIFSPESAQAGDDYIFINIELENIKKDFTEFDESIFQLGIGKPLATDSITGTGDKTAVTNDDLEKRILKLFENSKKSRDFDLWEDHLKTKEQKSILENDVPELDDFEEKDFQDNEEKLSSLDDEDVFNEFVENNETNPEELGENFIDELELEDNDSDDKFEYELEEDLTKNLEPVEETLQVEDISADENDEVEKNGSDYIEKKEEIHGETELPIQENKIEPKQKKIEDHRLEEELVDHEQSFEQIDDIENEEEVVEDENTSVAAEIEHSSTEKSNKLIISVLIAIFIIIAGFSIYYVLFRDSINSADQYEAAIDLNDQNIVEQADKDASLKKEKIVGEDIIKDRESVQLKQGEEISTLRSSEPDKPTPEESEVSKNIFFDGTNYSIQVSSWKQRIIAEREEQKLIKKGYPTFIQQIYIKKFDGIWNRVRVGPFATLEEAKEVHGKLNK